MEETRNRVDFTAQRDILAGSSQWRRMIFNYYGSSRCHSEGKGEPIPQGDAPEQTGAEG